jgi:glycosyltransferase involved in cell wall biosynthesis
MAGGAEVFTHEVATRWVNSGHDVTLLSSGFEGGLREEILEGVRVLRQGSKFSVYRRVRERYLQEFQNRSQIAIDEINTRPFLTPRYVNSRTTLCALLFQLAREYWFYETPFPVNLVGRYWLENHWLSLYKNIPTFTISRSTKNDLEALGFHNVTIVPVGVSTRLSTTVPIKDATPTLIYVGRLTKAKRAGDALRAFAIVRRHLPSARLWVVGDGYLKKKLERRAPDGTVFFGKVSEAKKAELLSRAHILIVPSIREGWGLTVTEANAVATPAVGYNVPGLRDSIRNGRTGFCVPFGDVAELARCSLRLLSNADEYRKIAQAALGWAANFTWDRTAAAMAGCFAPNATISVPTAETQSADSDP